MDEGKLGCRFIMIDDVICPECGSIETVISQIVTIEMPHQGRTVVVKTYYCTICGEYFGTGN